MRRIICILGGHIRNVAPCTYYYNIHVHIHCDCACAFHLRSHVGRETPPSATRIIPRGTMRATAHRGRWVKCVAGSIYITRFSLSRVCQYSHAKLVKMQHKSCSPFCSILLPFSPTYAHKLRGWGEGGNSRDLAFFSLCSSMCTCKIGLNCCEMLLPVSLVWNFVAFAHLPYL